MMYWELARRQGDLRSFSSPGSRTLSKAWTKSSDRKELFLDPKLFGKASYSRRFYAEQPNGIPPTVESKIGQLSNQNLNEILDIQLKI